MKYVGLTIDSQWTFGAHFELLVPSVTTAANALFGLLPNFDGVEVGIRRLYEGVVRSRVLFGAPVWAEDLIVRRRSLLRMLHRTTVIRIVRGYRTLSYASTSVLAASPPFEALALGRVYALCQPVGPRRPRGGEAGDLGAAALSAAGGRCCAATPGRSSRLPNWEAWKDRDGVPLTFRTTSKDSAGGDFHLSPLRGGGKHGAAHTGVLSSVGRTAPRPAVRHRREISPPGDRRSHAERATGVCRHPLLLRASHAHKGASGEKQGETTLSK
jgi:hypothetical protein